MIELSARDFPAFTAVFRHFHNAGVDVMATGGNRGTVPDSTPWPLVAAAAGMDGVEVHTDLPVPPDPSAHAPDPQPPAPKARRTRKPSAAPADTGV